MNKRLIVVTVLCASFAGLGAAYFPYEEQGMRSFVWEYSSANSAKRIKIAKEYIKSYSAEELLREYEKRDPTCHVVAHEMGRVVYRKYQNLEGASRECLHTCSDGCFHGVLMEMFAAEGDVGPLHGGGSKEVVGYVANTANDLCSRPSLQKYVRPWKCLHGLGHMLAYATDYDLEASIQACENVQGGSFAHNLCVSGVFMEFMESKDHQAQFVREDYDPCDHYVDDYAIGCYRFREELMVRVRENDEELYEGCRTLSPNKRRACFMGVGWGVVDRDRTNTDFKTLCAIGDATDKEACIEGVGAFVAINSNTEKDLCTSLPGVYRESCERTIRYIREFKP